MSSATAIPVFTLQGVVQSAPDGAHGFDSNTVLSAQVAGQFAQDYNFCIRYLSLAETQRPGDLSQEEASNILDAGLALMAVQHVRKPGWVPSASAGQQDGANAASNAASVGLPNGMNIWCDLEGVADGTSPEDVIAHCTSWFTAVSAAGFVPGLYVGCDAILNGQQLYDLPFEHYWQSCSTVPALPGRGYQMVQTLHAGLVNGIGIDDDVTRTDGEGGQALLLAIPV